MMLLVDTYPTAHPMNREAAGVPSPIDAALQVAKTHTWNRKKPTEIRECVHDLIQKRTIQSPLAEAVKAWDGSLTYQELDDLSNCLVDTLRTELIEPGSVIPLCFEKSKWTIVAILAVMKIGAAFLLLDPAHPVSRLRYMITTVQAKRVLCSTKYSQHESLSDLQRIVVDESSIKGTSESGTGRYLAKSDPCAALYLMFTSGTTGMPKGFTIEHRAFCSSALNRAEIIQRDEKSRVLQFAAFTFDPCMEDMLTTLMVGGCICIPSDEQRVNDLGKCIRDLDANFLNVTPGVSDLIEPEDVPGLKVLLLSGESMKEAHIQKWSSHLQLINGYGPSECCIKCAVNPHMIPGTKPYNIGRPVGSSLWIVNPSNLEEIRPIGVEGELLIEGPTLARGYLQPNAANSFAEAPRWLKELRNDPAARLYKTGDLAVYRTDGTIDFIGRRDTQTKINGQRVELGEIESLIWKLTDKKYRAVVELVPLEGEQHPSLIACIARKEAPAQALPLDERYLGLPSSEYTDLGETLSNQLAAWLPRYMIPSFFLPISSFPLTIHGKTDRKRLKIELSEINRDVASSYSKEDDTMPNATLSAQENALFELWCDVLSLDFPDGHGQLDFFQLGGNSFSAVRLVAAARRKGLQLTVAAVLQHPRLSDQARDIAASEKSSAMSSIPPFSLLLEESDTIRSAASKQCSLNESEIEDIYPCTPLQSYWIDYTLKHPDELHALWVYSLPTDIDIAKLQDAWERVVAGIPSLRTRAITSSGRYLQAIDNRKPTWGEWTSLPEFLKRQTPQDFTLGQPLSSAAIIIDGQSKYFALKSQHAAWDGWCKDAVFICLEEAYKDTKYTVPTSLPLTHLVKQIQDTDKHASHEFWSSQLSNRKYTPFFHKPAGQPVRSNSYHFNTAFPNTSRTNNVTLSTLIQAAWGLTVRGEKSSDSVLLTTLLSGREIALPGVDEIIAPTAAQVPLPISVDRQDKAGPWLEGIQERLISTIPYMHTEWSDLFSQLGADVQEASESSPLIVIHAAKDGESEEETLPLGLKQVERIFTHKIPFTVECYVSPKGVKTDIFYDEAVFSAKAVQDLCKRFETMLENIWGAGKEQLVSDVLC